MIHLIQMGNPFVGTSTLKWGVFADKVVLMFIPCSRTKTYICAISAELARRVGHRRDKQNFPLGKSDVKVDQLGACNHRKHGEQINESKRVGRITPPENAKPPSESNVTRECSRSNKLISPECIPEYETVIRENPAIPATPRDFGNFDFAILEDKARELWFPDDKWVGNGHQVANDTHGEDTRLIDS